MQEEEKEKEEEESNEAEDIEVIPENEDQKSSFGKEPSEVVIKELKEKLKACSQERQEYLEGWQRSKADFINARKEEEHARTLFRTFAKQDFLLQVLPVADSFEIAFSDKTAWEAAPQEWRVGVEYIYSQLKKILEDNGFSQTKPLGEKFDPALHEAAEIVPTEEKEKDGMILQVIESGYLLEGKVVRAPRVKVGQYKTGN